MAKDIKGKELPNGIRQRKNGKYEGRVQYEMERHSVYANSISELKKSMNELRYKLEHGDFIANSKMTVSDWFAQWMKEYKENQVKIGTVITYNNYYDYYVKGLIGNKKIVDIQGQHIQRLYNSLVNKKIAVSTIKIISAIMSGCFKQAVKNGIIDRNPISLATIPRETEKKARRVFTKEEQELFMEYAKESYLYNLFALDLRTGMRSGEIRGLKLSDMDKNLGVIHVKRTLKYEGGERGFFEDTPKTRTSMRDIPITKDIACIIDNEKKKCEHSVIHLNEYLFHLPDGMPISRDRLQSEIDRIVVRIQKERPEFKRFTPHCFRHTFATRAIESGMKPQTLKCILGHSTLSMTMDLYSHVLPTTKAEEMELIAKAF